MNWIVRAIATLAILTLSGGLLSACKNQNLQIFVNQKIAESFYKRGLERLGSKDYQGAIADFNQVIRRQSSNYQAYSHRCLAWIKIGKIQSAIADCDRAVQINPKNGDVRYNRANVRRFLGDWQGMSDDLQMAASIYQQEGNMEGYREAMRKYRKYSNAKNLDGNR